MTAEAVYQRCKQALIRAGDMTTRPLEQFAYARYLIGDDIRLQAGINDLERQWMQYETWRMLTAPTRRGHPLDD